MSLRQNSFASQYETGKNDVVNDFYIPALSNCAIYKRVSAYFDSGILNLYAKGLENIVAAKGHVYFVFSNELTESDFNEMKAGYADREKRAKIENGLLQQVSCDSPSVNIRNLAYLIANGYVDVKIAFTQKGGIFHDKFGLIYQGNDVVYFRGSNNETPASVLKNFESFETTCSWNCDQHELEKINNNEKLFDDLWHDRVSNVRVVDIPDVVKEKIVSYSDGKLNLVYQDTPNSLVFDCDDDFNVFIINNLDAPRVVAPTSFFYMRVFSAYAEKNDGKTIKLQSGVGYVAVKFMIKEVMKAKETFHFNCVVSGRLRRFLDESDLHLNERRSLGTAIKKKDPLILSDYFQFQTAVNKLLDRPLIGDQSLAAYHIVKMKRAANFSVPGAGKTTMVLAAFAYLHSLGLVDKIMMIGPLNSFGSWKREWLATFGSKLKLNAFDYQENKYGTAASRYDAIQRGGAESNLFLINYESLQNNVEALTSVINSRTMLVFDEVHRIKSLTGQRASAALSLCQKAVYRVVLTGTPIPNGYADIYNFLHILFPDEYDDFFTFDVRYLEGAENDPQKQLAINKAINPFFFILTKQDLHVPMPEPDDLTTCRAYVNANEQKLLEMVYEKYRYDPLALCIRLVQAASNPKLLLSDIDYSALEDTDDDTSIQEKAYGKHDKFTGQQASFIKSLPMGQKFYLAIDQIEKLAMSRQQVMVWALFIDTINETESELKNRGIDCRVIYGAVPLDEREKIISDFINGRFDVLIANPNTLAESVSLHKNCHNAVYIEYSYNLVHMLQSRDRIHRVGLLPDQKTRYYYAILDSHEESFQPIDLRIYNRLQEKAKLESDAMSNDYLGYVKIDHDKDIIDMMADAKSASF